MKTIIIPAHCGAACADQLKAALNMFANERVTCIFVQIRPLPDNYNDMLTLGRSAGRYESFNKTFTRKLSILKNFYGGRVTFKTDYIYGDSPAVFRNYIKNNAADLVVYDSLEWARQDSRTVNVFKMVRRCGCELMYMSGNPKISNGLLAKPHTWETIYSKDAISHRYAQVDRQLDQLDELVNNDKIISKKFTNVSRYFLNESLLEKMLVQSGCSLVLLRK